ncbi:MAG: 50S ribosomal protein L33 [Chloroflexota bacterium]|nr:50S ribosomal protein L33 [Chloroflexota bacterium]NOG62887.1 50S ribosomal protein L33 [Chloroflexota bacterium]GIK63544.1 MAG: 50S ribosomal protein L33 [Chloroflexota bacterium]
MAKKKKDRSWVRLVSTESNHVYYTEKNKRNDTGRMEIKKYDPTLRRHVLYRESK